MDYFDLEPDLCHSPESTSKRWVRKMLNTRFLLIAVLIHGLALLFFGGMVLFVSYKKIELTSSNLIAPPAVSTPVAPPSSGQETKIDVSVKVPEMPKMEATALANSKLSPTFNVDIPVSIPVMSASQTDFGSAMGNGLGSGSGTGSGSFGSLKTLFGSGGTFTDGLQGTLYDFKQTKDRKKTNISHYTQFNPALLAFIENWNLNRLDGYYKSPKTLITSQFFIPLISASEAPKAFEVEKEVEPKCWAAIYHGSFTPVRNIKFRFVGIGDDWMVVRMNGRIVLDASLENRTAQKSEVRTEIANNSWGLNDGYKKGAGFIYGGKWMTLSAGVVYDMDVVLAEAVGGYCAAFLGYEEEGKQYKPRKDDPKHLAYSVFQIRPTNLPKYEVGTHGPDFISPKEDEIVFKTVSPSNPIANTNTKH